MRHCAEAAVGSQPLTGRSRSARKLAPSLAEKRLANPPDATLVVAGVNRKHGLDSGELGCEWRASTGGPSSADRLPLTAPL